MAWRSKTWLTPIKKVTTLKLTAPKEHDKRYATNEWRNYSKRHRGLNPRCAMCQQLYPIHLLQTDHVIPVHLGGSFWDKRNHQTLCQPCHGKKTRKEVMMATNEFVFNDKGEKIPAWTAL